MAADKGQSQDISQIQKKSIFNLKKLLQILIKLLVPQIPFLLNVNLK